VVAACSIFSVSVCCVLSNCAGERNPSVECRRRRLKKTSMYSKTSVRSSALVGHERPWMSSFFSVAKKLSATALRLLCQG
jgi:hypothetical protein